MIAVVQRVRSAGVEVNGSPVAEIGRGFLVLLGVGEDDTERDAEWMAEKVASLRIFEDEAGKMNLALPDVGGAVLAVSQFTLLGDCRKGRRPSFVKAAPPEKAEPLYRSFIERLIRRSVPVAAGVFQARMAVSLVNDGPVTLILRSP